MRNRQFYFIRLQYLGFRYSGWQKQPNQKTIEGMLLKTLKYILPKRTLKIVGAGRTDAKVSAIDAACSLILDGSPIENEIEFLALFNANLPPDIRIISMQKSDNSFNIIQDSKLKEYHYYFSYGQKNHPFCAPLMANFVELLDIKQMIAAAQLFEGTHNFYNYTAKKTPDKSYTRTVTRCRLEINKEIEASFFPQVSYVLKIKSKGFGRYQVRMIMGALLSAGRNELSLDDIANSLKENVDFPLSNIVPGSGLVLHRLSYEM